MTATPEPPAAALPGPLQRAFPGLAAALPWWALGRWPTPVAPLTALGRAHGAPLWVKRDDLSAPAYGGNKVRKLEPLLARALALGYPQVVTVGGLGSNHVVATAVHAARLGLGTRAVVVPQPVSAAVQQNLELCRALDVELIPCPARALALPYLAHAARRPPRAMIIGPGGSSPLGTLGYVAAGLELARQVQDGLLPEPAELYVALGSGGTAAGLSLGCALAGLRTRVVAVAVVERALCNRTLVRSLIRRTARLLRRVGNAPGPLPAPRPGALQVLHGYLGRGYGHPTEAGTRALQEARDSEGLHLDPTYTGKALAALLERCASGPAAGAPCLFWNTYNSQDLGDLLRGGPRRDLPLRIARWLGGG